MQDNKKSTKNTVVVKHSIENKHSFNLKNMDFTNLHTILLCFLFNLKRTVIIR